MVDFLHEMKVGLQSWLRKILRDADVVKLPSLMEFLKVSDPFTDNFTSGLDDDGSLDEPISSSLVSKLEPFFEGRIDHLARSQATLALAGSLDEEREDLKETTTSLNGGNANVNLDHFIMLKVIGVLQFYFD